MAIGTATAIIIGATMATVGAVGGSVYAASEEKKGQKKILAAADQKQKEMEDKANAAEALAAEEAKRKRAAKYAGQTQTILTSPLGITDETGAEVKKPIILGGG